ncbi:hypothetical protein [Endozoicomonas numazuensis]|uniref:hypothetical protein n=1 Tax=Endozoicomonas numazuensis TaxID=1137799 RepID=UPI001268B6CC|nr:hypothetical protein [Endozoicomonas numazuensis]
MLIVDFLALGKIIIHHLNTSQFTMIIQPVHPLNAALFIGTGHHSDWIKIRRRLTTYLLYSLYKSFGTGCSFPIIRRLAIREDVSHRLPPFPSRRFKAIPNGFI